MPKGHDRLYERPKRKQRKRKAKIIVLPGIERRDLLPEVPSQNVLKAAIEQGVTDAVVVGKDRSGELFVATEAGDVDRAVGILFRGVNFLTSARITNDQA